MPETDLIKRCKKGDREAFNELFSQYQSKVINIAYGMLSDCDDANDAAQEVFIRVYKSIDSFKGHSSLSTWIYRITSNVCNDILRKRMRTAPSVSISAVFDDDKEMDLPDNSLLPEDYAEYNEAHRAVRKAMSELSDEYREIITLYDVHDLSYEKISAVLKCPVGTVKSRLNRARTALKKKLSENMELFL